MSIEQRLEQVERQTKRLRIAVVVLAAALCGVVSMAATKKELFTHSDVGKFGGVYSDFVVTKRILVNSDEGKTMVDIDGTTGDSGIVRIYNSTLGKISVALAGTDKGGYIATYGPYDNSTVTLNSTSYGGSIFVSNKIGKTAIGLIANDSGNGEISVWDISGEASILKSEGILK